MAISLLIRRAVLPALMILQHSFGDIEIVAHRGASFDAPENSLSAMKLAWEQEADAIELDLYLSKDGHLVVFHDGDTKRYEPAARKITSLTWKEIQQLEIGTIKGPQFKNERVPTLESILKTIPEKKRAYLEIKGGVEVLPELEKVLKAEARPASQIVIIAFNANTLAESKKLMPSYEHYLLFGYDKNKTTGELPTLESILAKAKEVNADGMDLNYAWPIDKAFVSKVKAAGLKLATWTVDDFDVALKLKEAGVDGITTNRPAWLRDKLK